MANAGRLIRPYGIVVDGGLELGHEFVVENGRVVEVRPHSGIPEPYVVSVPFVNAHSHLEYRGLLGAIEETEFWPWIREITRLKPLQSMESVEADTFRAAEENRRTGVALIGEHSDRPYAGGALRKNDIGGWLFQELITLFERESPEAKRRCVAERLAENLVGAPAAGHIQGVVSPHALYTVDQDTLRDFGEGGARFSIHLAESPAESQLTRDGSGPIAEFYRSVGAPLLPTGESAFGRAKGLGLVRQGAQLVHCCDLSTDDVEDLARSRATVAHCPRSNAALGCPIAPIREMLDAGVQVGLGLDSPASSGPIDFFAEMRAAASAAKKRGRPISFEDIWRMSTSMGARSLWREDWDLRVGWQGPLIAVHVDGAHRIEDVILGGTPESVEWL